MRSLCLILAVPCTRTYGGWTAKGFCCALCLPACPLLFIAGTPRQMVNPDSAGAVWLSRPAVSERAVAGRQDGALHLSAGRGKLLGHCFAAGDVPALVHQIKALSPRCHCQRAQLVGCAGVSPFPRLFGGG